MSQTLRGRFHNLHYPSWLPRAETEWQTVLFNQFSGDEIFRNDLRQFVVPFDGVYVVTAKYGWRSTDAGASEAVTAISTNNQHFTKLHHLQPSMSDMSYFQKIGKFKRGDRVCLKIYGHQNAEYALNSFEFEIEQLF